MTVPTWKHKQQQQIISVPVFSSCDQETIRPQSSVFCANDYYYLKGITVKSLERRCRSAVFCIWSAEILMTHRVWGKPIPLIQSASSDSKQGRLKKSILKCDFQKAAVQPGGSAFGFKTFGKWEIIHTSNSNYTAAALLGGGSAFQRVTCDRLIKVYCSEICSLAFIVSVSLWDK